MTTIPPLHRKMLDRILTIEGGFTPRGGGAVTLFGVTDAVWSRETGQSLEASRREMQDVGRLLVPFSDNGKPRVQPATGMPFRSLEQPLPNLSPTQNARVQAGREKAYGILYHEFTAPGFDKYPSFIQLHLMDFCIHVGPSRARWAMMEAMVDTGIMPRSEYNKITQLSARDVVPDQIFRPLADGKRSPAGFYGSRDCDALMLKYLKNLTPEKERDLIKAYGQERREYYTARKEITKDTELHLEGWIKRSNMMDAYSFALGIPELQRFAPSSGTAPRAPAKPKSPAL